MAQSLIVDWLNENENRAYPLRETVARVVAGKSLDNIILDASFCYTTLAQPTVTQLTQLVVTADTVTVTVTDQPIFIFDKQGSFPQYVRNSEGSLLVLGQAVLDIRVGMYELAVLFEDCVSTEFRDAWKGVEQITFNSPVNSVNETIIGDIIFNEGYQMDIRITGTTIRLHADQDYGLPVGCTNFFLPTNDCSSIISSINSSEVINNPGIFNFTAGKNIRIIEDVLLHRIYIGLNFDAHDVCKQALANPNN